MKVYFISGLAADRRVFLHIKLPEGFEPVYLEWIPFQKNEDLREYASRLAEKIDHNEKFVIIGLSMGGMMATEIAKIFSPAITILISSIPVSNKLPLLYKVAAKLSLYKFIPVSVLTSGAIIKRLFTRESNEDKRIIKQIIYESDPAFIKWGLKAILTWNNNTVPEPLLHIHGTRDGILPIKKSRGVEFIGGGSHLMVMTHADAINEKISKALQSLQS